jgi:hypothetical protein
MGATMRLICEGLIEVRALGDAEALRQAKPRWRGDLVILDHDGNAACEEAMVLG